MQCAESLRVQAYFDHEVDALGAADVERHLGHCADCRALLQDLERLRTAMRRDLEFASAPAALRGRIMVALDRESAPSRWRPRSFWAGALGGMGGTALAAACALFLLLPRAADPLLDELANAHVRSLMPAHLIDVVSTDRHTVKPWFAGHADVSPAVADFQAQGFLLIGGRADYLDHQRSAVVVYQHGAHIVNVFSWAARDRPLPRNVTRSGYHFVFWRSGDLGYCAVSDAAPDELFSLVRLLRDAGAGDARE